ncbi:MAG: hypothetical protein ACXADY_26535, partial [Candidatus Hodarchaeales archaeon]
MPLTSAADIDLIRFIEQSLTPNTPATGYSGIYMKSDGLYVIDDAGTVTGPLTDSPTGAVLLDPTGATYNTILPTGGDYTPLTLRGYATTPAADLFVVKEGAAGATVHDIDATGVFTFVPALSGTLGGYGGTITSEWTPGAASSNNHGAMWVKSQFDGTDNTSGYITGIEILCDILSSGTANMRGLDIYCWNDGAGTVSTADGIYIENIEAFGGGSITTSRALYIDGQTGATNSYAIVTNAGQVVFNEGGHAEADIRIETDTEDNFIYVDTGAEWIRFGDWDTNYVEIDTGGDICFVGGAG